MHIAVWLGVRRHRFNDEMVQSAAQKVYLTQLPNLIGPNPPNQFMLRYPRAIDRCAIALAT